MQEINTIIIGAGQAGLSTSYYLKQNNIDHLILEEHQTAHNWKEHRPDSFSLVTPNWMNQLPGFPYQGDDPHGFLTKEEVIQYMDDYVKSFDPPIVTGQKVLSVKRDENKGYVVKTRDEIYHADHVVVATGIYHHPRIPAISKDVPQDIFQIHSNDYKNPDILPPGNVLVVGAGRSGIQIAYEVQKSGRNVFLCVGSSGDLPFSYRGYHGTLWLNRLAGYRQDEDISQGFMKQEEDQFIDLRGKMSLHLCKQEGVMLLGHLMYMQEGKAKIRKDLQENLTKSQGFLKEFEEAIDQYLQGTKIPKIINQMEDSVENTKVNPLQEVEGLDLSKENITSIIWCTGYHYGYDWVDVPVFDEKAYPIQKRGITPYKGLYFIGLHLIPKMKKQVNFGVGLYAVGEDAKIIAKDIMGRNASEIMNK